MNIDLEKAKQEFIKYTEKYNLDIENIKAKQTQSLRVMEVAKQIAEGIGISNEDVELATLIGLLHDIARFEQFTQYGTYKDLASFDHGDVGAEILQKDIRQYIETDQYDNIIIKAVQQHNKFGIEEGLNEKEELFAKIVRDADKIDIFYQGAVRFWKGREQEVNDSIISQDVIEQIQNCSQTKRKLDETPIDNIMRVIAFIFDLNFKSSFQILKEEDYINKTLNRYNLKDDYTKQQVEEIRDIANRYIEEKAK